MTGFRVTDVIVNSDSGEQVLDLDMPSTDIPHLLASLPKDTSSVVITLVRSDDNANRTP